MHVISLKYYYVNSSSDTLCAGRKMRIIYVCLRHKYIISYMRYTYNARGYKTILKFLIKQFRVKSIMIYYACRYFTPVHCSGGVYIHRGKNDDNNNNNSNNINKTKLDVCFGFRAHPRSSMYIVNIRVYMLCIIRARLNIRGVCVVYKKKGVNC
jgi:hypothetical protein